MTEEPNSDPNRAVYLGGPPGVGIAVPAHVAEQLALDDHDPDAMEDRGARLRAELDRLDTAKTAARLESLGAAARAAEAAGVASRALDDAVAEARAYGATWQQIGDAVGLVKSAAWERWAHR
jgi:hypothetical protein